MSKYLKQYATAVEREPGKKPESQVTPTNDAKELYTKELGYKNVSEGCLPYGTY